MPACFERGVTYGDVSWHALEKNLPADHPDRFSVEQTLKHGGMDTVIYEKVQLAIAGPHDQAGTVAGGAYGIFRTDKAPWECMGHCGAAYEVLQNHEIFEYFQPFLDTKELSFESAGLIDGGRRVFVEAKIADSIVDLGGGDTIIPYVLITSGHDGYTSTKAGFTPIRTVCANTVALAHRDKSSKLLTVRHTKGQKPALDLVMKSLDLARREFVANCEQYKLLKECPINQTELARYVRRVLDIELTATWDEVSNKKKETYNTIITKALGGIGNDELNAWTAYNGVTEWLAHVRGKEQNDRIKSLWFGEAAVINRNALDLAMAMAA